MSLKLIASPLAALCALLLLAGCAGAQSGMAPTTEPRPASDSAAPAPSTCVSDPAAVVARLQHAAANRVMSDSLAAVLDTAASSSLATAATPGAIVAVRSPEGTFVKAYGVADPATGAPMTADMFQRVGSITKTFTGTIIMQLVADGRISLDDTIDQYVKGVTNGNTVTIRMLADMTSGVASYTVDDGFQSSVFGEPYRQWKPDELLAIGLALPARFTPGAQFDYSNTNTVLLGKVIEKVTGTPFDEALQSGILTPLKLDGTSFPGESAVFPEPHPQGFTLQGSGATPADPTNATEWNPSWGWTAGEMISTADDLLTFGRALGTGQGILAPADQIVRLSSYPGAAGYGLGSGCSDGWVGHTGELPGYNTSMFYDTVSDTTVVTMTNSDIKSGSCATSPTLLGNPTDLACSSPATRIFVAVAAAIGRPFTPNPSD